MSSASRKSLQLTLAILKPNVVSHPHLVHQIKELIHQKEFLFIRSKRMHLPRARVEDFYREHEGRFFYNRLVSFMSSGPISTHILARENAIAEWRKLMGATKVFKTIHEDPNSIRGQFGLTDTRNSTHGSDSDETALKEMNFFFPEFDVEDWYRESERHFLTGDVYFDDEHDIHRYKLNHAKLKS
ncbi:nucleoside diphosphate kinase 6-like [Ruditapes philippinarum]|uniref:nucleoside diphosphate kinase 6-like n=1 Tax=Ruditapes philippinarum TaxID=129788 RepID=UPI00295A756C|nr:nucleoside diphosphate kinase 6-like [Ruditapes philippinarum]